MKFLKTVAPEWSEMSEEQRTALYAAIRSFVRAGGVVTLTEWLELSPAERVALELIRNGGIERELGVLEGMADQIERKVTPREPAKT